jgi:uncharacterized protein (TIGR02391 family)
LTLPSFKPTHLEAMCRALVDGLTHRELTHVLDQCQISEQGGAPRWERLLLALSARQRDDRCGNNVAAFIQAALDPARFVGRPGVHSTVCEKVNQLLAFSGLHIEATGKLREVEKAGTLSEAEHRAKRLRENLLARRVHPEVLAFCQAELVHDNYFHAVLEATKSVAEKIRQRTDLVLDGAELVDWAFGGDRPLLALTSLLTETQRSEQRGFVNLLKGFFGTFRNPTAHSPKVVWPIDEADALDLLTLASYLHRRVDAAVRTL